MLILICLDGPSYQAHNSTEEQVTPQGQAIGASDITQEPGVRFSSVLQEIEPEHSLHTESTQTQNDSRSTEPLSPEVQEEIRNLSKSLQHSNLEHRITNSFTFEPVSLPVSRVSSIHNPMSLISEALARICRHLFSFFVERTRGSTASPRVCNTDDPH